jgi:putative ABC transport system permease protein
LAILPGVALQELWDLMSVAEQTLLAVSTFVVLVGLTGMLTVILASLNERRREMAIMRSVGARPAHVFALIIGEAGFLTIVGTVLGLILLYAGLMIGQPILESRFGLFIGIGMISTHELHILGLVIAAGFLIGVIPAYRAYRYSLADGMTIRL